MRPKNYWPFGGFEPGGAADEVTDGPTDKVVAGIEVGVPLPVGVVMLFYPFESICENYSGPLQRLRLYFLLPFTDISFFWLFFSVENLLF